MPQHYKRILQRAKESLALYDPDSPNPDRLSAAQSAAYYALFHAVAQHCADALMSSRDDEWRDAAWMRLYCALNHSAFNKGAMTAHKAQLPPDLAGVMQNGAQLKISRHIADYDPDYIVSAADAEDSVDLAGRMP